MHRNMLRTGCVSFQILWRGFNLLMVSNIIYYSHYKFIMRNPQDRYRQETLESYNIILPLKFLVRKRLNLIGMKCLTWF